MDIPHGVDGDDYDDNTSEDSVGSVYVLNVGDGVVWTEHNIFMWTFQIWFVWNWV